MLQLAGFGLILQPEFGIGGKFPIRFQAPLKVTQQRWYRVPPTPFDHAKGLVF